MPLLELSPTINILLSLQVATPARALKLKSNPMNISGLILAVLVGSVFFFAPTIIALKKRNAWTIFLCNLFFGATGVGWGVCLIWAIKSE
ncbi:MAG: superinfection immunity protein [Mucilaginibacter sp.]